MRTLNRPMFNMGGPIKQGIMHGIREPYRGGGQAALVGNPVYPQTGGREHHRSVKTVLDIGKHAFGKAGQFFKGRTKGRLPSMPKTQIGTNLEKVTTPGKSLYSKGYPGGPGVITTYKAGKPIMGNIPFKGNKWNWIKQFSKENPYWATAGAAGAATVPNLAWKTAPSIAGAAGNIGKTWIDAVLPGDQSKWFTKEKIAEDLKPVITGGAGGAGGEGLGTKDTSTAESRAAFANKQRQDRVNKYLDMMGYDRSKKTAIGDALIDASKIVSDRGTLDRKNITRDLINPIIQATSKRFDKPEQIREAVGLMMTKADLEKEMYQSKPGTQLKAAQDYVSEFGGSMANAYKQLGLTKKGGFTESLGALSKQYGKTGMNNQKVIIENIKFQKADDPSFDIDSIKVLGDNEMLESITASDDFVSVTDSILQHKDAHVEKDGQRYAKPGIYIMGTAVIEVDENGIPKRLN